MTNKEDRLFSRPGHMQHFSFDDDVAVVFDDMIRRSVPGYQSILTMIGWLSGEHAQTGTNLYDLGASLGAATSMMAKACSERSCRVIAVDNSTAMVEQLRENLHRYRDSVDIDCADIRQTDIRNASVVVMNLVMQFLEPTERRPLLQEIYDGLNPGGILLLTEKIIFEDRTQQARMTELYYDFKRANGYSGLEIAQKRAALENVLVCDTLETHVERLEQVGFGRIDVWFKAMTFMSLIAYK